MLAWIIGNVLGVMVFLIIAILYTCLPVPELYRQWRCKHTSYRENRACDAICKTCGKNLGFIGSQGKKP